MNEDSLWIPVSKIPQDRREAAYADMAAERVLYRYRDPRSFTADLREDQPSPPRIYIYRKLDAAFWLVARINWAWSTAVAGPMTVYGLEIKLDGAAAESCAVAASQPNADDHPPRTAGRTSDPRVTAFLREEVKRTLAAGSAPTGRSAWTRVLHRKLKQFTTDQKKQGRVVFLLSEKTISNRINEFGIPAEKLARN